MKKLFLLFTVCLTLSVAFAPVAWSETPPPVPTDTPEPSPSPDITPPPINQKKCSQGRCTSLAIDGIPCTFDSECTKKCDTTTFTCGTTGTGRSCKEDLECRFKACDEGTCVGGAAGRRCSVNADCTQKRCLGAACVRGGVGEICTADSQCDSKSTCRTIHPVEGGGGDFGVIVCSLGVYSSMSCNTSSDCTFDKRCKTTENTCAANGTGDLCRVNDDCNFKRCKPGVTGGICASNMNFHGTPCTVDGDCTNKTCADDGTCVEGSAYTASCAQNADCKFKLCNELKKCVQVDGPGEVQCMVDIDCEGMVSRVTPKTFAALDKQPISAPETLKKLKTIRSGYFSAGKKNAKLEIFVFQDLKCGMCKKANEELFPHIQKAYVETGKATFTYVEFPIGLFDEETKLANGVLCAHDQGKYLSFVSHLYKEMKTTSSTNLVSYAKELGVKDIAAFSECVLGMKHYKKITDTNTLAKSLGVDGTPTFFINGHRLAGAMPPEAFDAQVEKFTKPMKQLKPVARNEKKRTK